MVQVPTPSSTISAPIARIRPWRAKLARTAAAVSSDNWATTPSELTWRAALADSAVDEGVELLLHRRVNGRRLVGGDQLLVDPVGVARGVGGPGLAPALEVAPVRDQRRIERGPVALLRVGAAEEMPAGPDLADGVQRQGVLVDRQRLEEARHHLQRVDVDHQLLERGAQAPLEPAGRVLDQVAAAHDHGPEREHGFVHRL